MSRPKFRGEPTFNDSLGSLTVTSTTTNLNTTGVTLIASPGAADRKIVVKSYQCSGWNEGSNAAGGYVLTDGTSTYQVFVPAPVNASNTAILSMLQPVWHVVQGNGIPFAANTAVTWKLNGTNAAFKGVITVKYDIVPSTGSDAP